MPQTDLTYNQRLVHERGLHAFWRDSRIEKDALFLVSHAKKLLKTHVAVWTLGAQHDHTIYQIGGRLLLLSAS